MSTDDYIRKDCPEFIELVSDVKDIKTGLLGSKYGAGGVVRRLERLEQVKIPEIIDKQDTANEEIWKLQQFQTRILGYTSGAAFAGGTIAYIIINVINWIFP